MKILNWITEHELDQLTRRSWIERQRGTHPSKSAASSSGVV